jgi:tetratricopeptide (TPR) repeat protein
VSKPVQKAAEADSRTSSKPQEALAKQLYERQLSGPISWSELPESDKAPWRAQAGRSLSALSDLGYRVERPADTSAARTAAERTATQAQTAICEAEKLLRMGEPLLAYNVVQEALADLPGNFRLRQLKGLALARSGALRRANEELASLRDEGCVDGETLGLLARTHKDLGLAATSSAARERHLAAAFEIYATGYRESDRRAAAADTYYTGINAATMAFLRGHIEQAREIAAEVEKLCQEVLQAGTADAYWPQATLAEAALIIGDEELARKRYSAAASLAGTRYGDLSSTRHQARLLLEHQGRGTAWLDSAMRIPPVLVYTGHMIDTPERPQPRFPPEMESTVRAEIRHRLKQLEPVAAYGSAACGADILCLECVQELSGELHIVLPFLSEQFCAESVDFCPDGHWKDRFERLLQSANEVLVISERPPPSGTSTFEYANLIMTGLARLRAKMLDTRLQGLAVWDGILGGGNGGTGSLVSMWRHCGVPLEHITLPAVAASVGSIQKDQSEHGPEPLPAGAAHPAFEYKIKAMLFADAVGYSRLSEDQIPLFFEHYVGTVAEFNEKTSDKAVHVETAGDGMYMVFDDTDTAAHYALDLSELINNHDWQSLGLPDDMSVRIGLHCGPVFVGLNPITGVPLFSGIHTSRTARIEPITPPGQVYASSAFAAVAAVQGSAGLRFNYIGRTQLAKDYGILPLYHVTRLESPVEKGDLEIQI